MLKKLVIVSLGFVLIAGLVKGAGLGSYATTAYRRVAGTVKESVPIEFQIDRRMAPVIADKIAGAGIPLIAIDIPHPHATYFGVDNYRVGFDAGELLAEHSLKHWKGKASWILGLDLEEAGTLVQSRITGAFDGITHASPDRTSSPRWFTHTV